jgi:hypothetical protein
MPNLSQGITTFILFENYLNFFMSLQDILEPLYDLHLALHGPVQTQTAINATHYGVNKQKQKCPICLDVRARSFPSLLFG